MEPSQEQVDKTARVKPLYWLAAVAMTIAIVLGLMEKPVNWLSIAGRVPLLVALVLLATAKPAETHTKKMVIYVLLAVSVALLLYRIFAPA